MNKIHRNILFRVMIGLPISWLGLTVAATCITWWHGIAIDFIYLALLIGLIGLPCCLIDYRNCYLLNFIVFMVALSFNIFGFILLFFPHLNAGTLIFLLLPHPFNYAIPALCLAILAFFSIKKILDIDYEKMAKHAYKEGAIDKLDAICFFNKTRGTITSVEFKNSLTSKYERLISGGILAVLFVTLGPFKMLGSTMAHNGNTPFNALFFMIGTYFMAWFCYFGVLYNFAQYQLIKKVERDLGKDLKPAFK